MNPEEKKAAGRTGRPKLDADQRKGYSVAFRPRATIKERLQVSAAASGLTVSEEIERRVEKSFVIDDEVGDIARLVGATIKVLEKRAGKKWNEDDGVRIEVRNALQGILDGILGSHVDVHALLDGVSRDLGVGNKLTGLKETDLDAADVKLIQAERALAGDAAANDVLRQVIARRASVADPEKDVISSEATTAKHAP